MTGLRYIAALWACIACAPQVLAQSAAGCEFSRFARGRVFDFGTLNGASGGGQGITTSLPLSGICSAQARVAIQSPGGANPEMRTTASTATLRYQVDAAELIRNVNGSAVRLLLSFDARDYTDTPAGVYEHHLVLTITP